MKRVHPNLSCGIVCAVVALSMGVSGCRSTSGGGPFLAPDRVPPPSTRALLPGQAQPYYPGDPLPAMQSAAGAPANAVTANPAEVESRTTSGRSLTWAAPPSNQPTTAAPAPVPVPVAPQRQPTVVAANEGAVSVPTDGDPLRFPLPAPREPENAAPVAPTIPVAAIATQPHSQPVRPPAPQPQHGVMLASYNAPVTAAPTQPAVAPPQAVTRPQAVAPPQVVAPPQITSPWRTPQITQAATQPYVPPLPAPPIGPTVQPQALMPTNTMAVTLREVPSPPAQPGDPMPRVRVPGYIGPPQLSSTDGFRPRTNMQ